VNTSTETIPKRRDRLAIIAGILESAMEGSIKTQIMYKANLSYEQLSEYFKFLVQAGLLEKRGCTGKEVYVTTPKGLEFLQRHREIEALLEAR
jgi:predicted transcriptional regulator